MGLKGAGGTPRGKCGTGGAIGMRLNGRMSVGSKDRLDADDASIPDGLDGFTGDGLIVTDGR